MKTIFNQRLYTTRIQRGLSQAKLAELSGITASSISHFEAGKRKPAYKTLIKLATCLNITTDFLMGNEEICQKIRSKFEVIKLDIQVMGKTLCFQTDSLHLVEQEYEKKQIAQVIGYALRSRYQFIQNVNGELK